MTFKTIIKIIIALIVFIGLDISPMGIIPLVALGTWLHYGDRLQNCEQLSTKSNQK